MPRSTPLLDRIAARRSAQEYGPRHPERKPGSAPTRQPAWLERLQAKDFTERAA